jgi:hypothetical protein
MEDFNKHESRKVSTDDLEEQRNYRELVPLPSDEDYRRLKENIGRNGFDPAKPIVVNEDMVVLDGHTRQQIARELGLEWVYAIVKDVGDHYDEKIYIIETNLDQRHLTKGQHAALALKVAEIKQEAARARQRLAGETVGKYNMKYVEKPPELEGDSNGYKLPSNWTEAYDERGESLELAARQVKGVGYDTVQRANKIQKAAQTDPDIAEGWEKVQKGEATVNQVYRQVQEKEKQRKKDEKPKSVYETLFNRSLPRKSGPGSTRWLPKRGCPWRPSTR